MSGGLTPEEESVLNSIGEAWGKFVELEQQHPSDLPEFHHAVHQMQQIVAMRVLRRDYPDYWANHKELCKEGSNICIQCLERGGRNG